jgi:general L-amino acid transport system substrate-binding protein
MTGFLHRIALAALGFVLAAAAAEAQTTLESVKTREMLICGANGSIVGFSATDAQGRWSGLDVDYCRAIAAAIFDDPDRVKFVPLSAEERFAALQSGAVDVLVRNTTWTSTRDTTLGLVFTGVNFYDYQAFMVRKALQARSALDLSDVSICVLHETTTELNLADYFRSRKMKLKMLKFATSDAAIKAYDSKRCDAYSADASGLRAAMRKLASPDEHMVLGDMISKEPLGPAVRQGDAQWFGIVRWVHFAMLLAEESGVTKANVADELKSGVPDIQRLLGTEGKHGEGLGLSNDWAYRIVKHVGNYGEVFERNVGQGSPLKLMRGFNALWTKGGLQYAPPIR